MSDEINKHHALYQATAQITAAYISVHKTALDDIPAIINAVYGSLDNLSPNAAMMHSEAMQADIDSSITPEYLICLEDGKKLKMLKRYLKTNYDMTPEEYRKRWNLPADYPMVAPNYAKRRSELAKNIGLGKQSMKQRKQNNVVFGKYKNVLPSGKGKMRIVKSTDIMMTNPS